MTGFTMEMLPSKYAIKESDIFQSRVYFTPESPYPKPLAISNHWIDIEYSSSDWETCRHVARIKAV